MTKDDDNADQALNNTYVQVAVTTALTFPKARPGLEDRSTEETMVPLNRDLLFRIL